MADSVPKVLGYVRVSTRKQAEGGVSLDVQEERIRAWVKPEEYDLVEVVRDGGKSAESLDRPGIQSVLRRIDSGEVAGLVVAKLDRLTRIVRDWCVLVDERFGKKGGPILLSVSEGLDLRSPTGRFFGNLIIAFSQCELETGVDRSGAVMTSKRARGEQLGTIPYGWKVNPEDGRTLVPEEEEVKNLVEMAGLRRQGMTIREIATMLDLCGVRPRKGKKWAASTIAKLLTEKPSHG